MNYARTALLLAAMTGLFLTVGYLIGGQGGMTIAFAIALAMNAFAYWNSDKLVLRMHGAQAVDPASAPQLHAIVAGLAERAQLPMPRVYIMHNDQPNAFATGRDPEHAAVAVTTGLLQRLDEQEIAGVLAHELAHVRNRDTLTMTITATLAGAIGMLGNFAFFFIGSRDQRDHPLGAMICGEPLALASALAKIHNTALRIDNPIAESNPATAHLFIINPLHGQAVDGLFSTHPSTENRIRRLQELARVMGDPRVQGRRGPWG